jgi:hypothetical protein
MKKKKDPSQTKEKIQKETFIQYFKNFKRLPKIPPEQNNCYRFISFESFFSFLGF